MTKGNKRKITAEGMRGSPREGRGGPCGARGGGVGPLLSPRPTTEVPPGELSRGDVNSPVGACVTAVNSFIAP